MAPLCPPYDFITKNVGGARLPTGRNPLRRVAPRETKQTEGRTPAYKREQKAVTFAESRSTEQNPKTRRNFDVQTLSSPPPLDRPDPAAKAFVDFIFFSRAPSYLLAHCLHF